MRYVDRVLLELMALVLAITVSRLHRYIYVSVDTQR